jgi:flagellar basal-body rod protein FlgB
MSMIDSPLIGALEHYLDLNAFRSKLIASNMANIDTPGYRTQDIDFRQELARTQGEFQSIGTSPMVRPVPGLSVRPDGNNVSLEREGLLLAETQLGFNTAIQLLRDQVHTLLSAIHEGSSS